MKISRNLRSSREEEKTIRRNGICGVGSYFVWSLPRRRVSRVCLRWTIPICRLLFFIGFVIDAITSGNVRFDVCMSKTFRTLAGRRRGRLNRHEKFSHELNGGHCVCFSSLFCFGSVTMRRLCDRWKCLLTPNLLREFHVNLTWAFFLHSKSGGSRHYSQSATCRLYVGHPSSFVVWCNVFRVRVNGITLLDRVDIIV